MKQGPKSRSVVTAREVAEWKRIRGWRYKDIALVYGYAWSTVWYHMAPKAAQEKQREAWRARSRRRYRAKILGAT